MSPRFAFLVHPLTAGQRRVIGLRFGDLAMMRGEPGRSEIGEIARVGIRGVVDGQVMGVTLLPDELLGDQERALDRMVRAVEALSPTPDAVGLGSLFAVVAGRGEGLAERVKVPVTTGAAATTWAALGNVRAAAGRLGTRRLALLGISATVGESIALNLAEEGYQLVLGGHGAAAERLARKIGAELRPEPEAVADSALVVSAATTGGTLDASALREGAVLLDVALPPTLKPGPRPRGVRVLAAEGVSLPKGFYRGLWGRPYQILAGYGFSQIYACLAEPMAMAVLRRKEPFALGRRLRPEALIEFSEAAARLGLRPRLESPVGWIAPGR